MKNKRKLLLTTGIGGVTLALLSGLLLNFNVQKEKHYKPGDYIPEEDAYYGGEITDPAMLVKAKKYVTPTDNKYNTQKNSFIGSDLIGDIEKVWDSYTGKNTTIAVIDDGFDYDHPEYTRNDGTSAILSTSRYYYASGNSYNYKEYSSNPSCIAEDWEETDWDDDENPVEWGWATHGTATSTTAAAPMGNNGGVGIAPDADILALKIDMTFAAMDGAIRYAVDQGADVINMSLGAYAESFTDGQGCYNQGYSGVDTVLDSACQYAYNHGVIIVAAAGNESTWHKSYPACSPHVIGVGATGEWYQKGDSSRLAEFTNYVDPSQTGEINVDILAPGYAYVAQETVTSSSHTSSSTAPSGHSHIWDDIQGTSFSSPIIAGAACLWKEKNPSGTPDQFLSELQSTADGIGYYTNKMVPVTGWYPEMTDVGPSNIQNGRLNVAKLLDVEAPFVNTVESSFGISVGERRQIHIESSFGTITYTSANSGIASVTNSGLIEGKAAGNTTITVTATKGTKTGTATITVHVDAAIATETMSFNPNSITISVGETYDSEATISVTPSNATRVFLFESDDTSIATVDEYTGLVTGVSIGTTTITGFPLNGSCDDTLTVKVEAPSKVSDTLTLSTTGVTSGSTSYTSWSGKQGTSGAVYAGQSAGGNDSIQLRSNNNNSGIVTTTSGGTISKVTVAWNSNTSGRTLEVYGKNSVYSSASDLYGANSGTQLGTINSDSQTTLTITGSYQFVGVRSSSGALYMDSITFEWSTSGGGGTPTPTVSSVTVSPASLNLDLFGTKTGNLSAIVNGTNSPAQTVNWSSSASSVATVSSSGVVTAVATGTATITATSTVDLTKSGTCTVTVVDTTPSGDEHSYSGDFNYDNKGSTWTLSDCTDSNSYWLCPASGSYSVALMPGVFDGKIITSDVVITINSATYGSGNDPTASTYKIYNSGACTSEVTSTKSGTLPTSKTYTDVTYTVSASNALASFSDDLAIKITKPGKQIRLKSISVEFDYVNAPDKIIDSLTATYSGSSIYVGGSLDETKVSVTASFTNPSTYTDKVLDSSDYSLTGFSSSTAGEKTVTVTYTGSLGTSATPLTTTFNVTVINDNVKNVTVTNSKTYHPGETISKSDITVTLSYDSGKSATTTDFTFADNGYQFQYTDAASGGSNTSKQFSITYGGQSYNFNVNVSRVAAQTINDQTLDLTGTHGASAGITGTGASGAANYESLNINGITCSATNIYVYNKNNTKYFSFGTSAGELRNITATSAPIKSFSILERPSNTRTDEALYVSVDGSDSGWVLVENADFANTKYYFFKVACESASSSYSNFNLRLEFAGQDNAVNVANYIMFEDTNNQCKSKLTLAVDKLNTMTNTDKSTFWNSNDYVIKTARERLLAWATHEGKTLSLVDNQFVLASAQSGLNGLFSANGDITAQIVLITTLLGISIFTCFFVIKRKRKVER